MASFSAFIPADDNVDIDHVWQAPDDNDLSDYIKVTLAGEITIAGPWQDVVSLAEAIAAYVTDEAERRDEARIQRVLLEGAA